MPNRRLITDSRNSYLQLRRIGLPEQSLVRWIVGLQNAQIQWNRRACPLISRADKNGTNFLGMIVQRFLCRVLC